MVDVNRRIILEMQYEEWLRKEVNYYKKRDTSSYWPWKTLAGTLQVHGLHASSLCCLEV
jgi:hypothetical protein